MNLEDDLDKTGSHLERRYDLDWLRVLAVLLLIYFHAAAVFYQGELGEFYIINDLISPALGWFIFFVHQWHMPLFFVIAGSATWFSLQWRTPMQYISDRFGRLFIPFTFGTLILVPFQVYYKLLNHHQYIGSYLQFYPQFFNGIRPQGNFEWAHLWFVIYLFVLSVVTLPILLFFKKQTDKYWYSTIATFMKQPGAIFLPALPLAMIEGALRPKWFGFQNLYNDWANLLLYLHYFVYGFLLCSDTRFKQVIDQYRTQILFIAVITMSILFGVQASNTLPIRGYSWEYILYQILRGFNSWCWVIAILGLGQRYLAFNNSILQYCSQASYPVYLLHQTVLVAIAFYVVQWNLGIAEKFLIISTASVVIISFLYDVLIKRLNIARFFFGLKPIDTKQVE
ncbi:acyltransferase [Komarekiella sp. 'clone 1']|uniref:Acyltransferase n=1 Tax=Komarekiella delphini-convector SJRDD-AB1 TaxID=2593771 RepID=A0AA40T4F4_9NOST|nr:acyltransferase [Komarekiella delphini-convector]MBD6620734.1 acyltransferase [Komarekiella delphini-convector SJRDD-AB1]